MIHFLGRDGIPSTGSVLLARTAPRPDSEQFRFAPRNQPDIGPIEIPQRTRSTPQIDFVFYLEIIDQDFNCHAPFAEYRHANIIDSSARALHMRRPPAP
jgi:hypothetical protein